MKMSPEELRAAAQREVLRLEASGEIDRVGDRQGVGASAAPAFDSMVGKTIEIRWCYRCTQMRMANASRCMLTSLWPTAAAFHSYSHTSDPIAQVYIWCSGEVVEVADGKTTKKSARCKSPLPWGPPPEQL